jgi:exopolysaccharide biosynthesis polyprenyl glycosylphosphotransferase
MRLLARRRKRRVAILADGPDTVSLSAFMQARKYGMYSLEAVLSPTSAGLLKVIEFVRAKRLDDIVLSNTLQSGQIATEHLFDLLSQPVDFHYFPDFFEQNLRKLPLAAINDFWVLESLGNSRGRRYDRIKRLLDIVVVCSLLPFVFPVLGFVALLVKLTGDGSVLFRQQRCGQYNRHYTIFKFRTMRMVDNSGAPTVANDDRVTRLGRFLRKTRLDELPQLWNVIRGDMSLIGPRPEQPSLAAELDIQVPFYRQRLLVRPGISGWDQVSGEYHSPSVEDTHKKLQSDLYYIKHRSLLFDLQILLKTFSTIFSRAGI